MILVLLGTQPFPFNRLIEELKTLVDQGITDGEHIIIQAGATPVEGSLFEVYDFIEKDRIESLMDEAKLIITHGGAGSIFDALEKDKKIIALARSAQFSEHVDEHQFELVEQLYEQHYILGCKTLEESFTKLPDFKFTKYKSNQEKIINLLQRWIKEN